jgi:diguanylate cyclase (GGDEF)-like protein
MEQLVREVFRDGRVQDAGLVEALEALASSRGNEVYRVIFRFLVGKDLAPEIAARYWREALARWENGSRLEPGRQQLRAALLDYLHQVVGERFASVTDGLTGFHTQAFGRSYLEKLLADRRGRRCSLPVGLVHLDIDGFKAYNERCGTMEGDRALRQVAELIRQRLRQTDVATRHGGTYCLILPDLDRVRAGNIAEQLRRAVAQTRFAGREQAWEKLTISCGVAAYPLDGDTAYRLGREAERQLRLAKAVRNCVQPLCAERRRNPRQSICSLVEYAPGTEPAFTPALALDISRGGIALGCDAQLPVGAALRLRFRRPFWPVDRDVSATIRQVGRDLARGVLRLGLELGEESASLLPAAAR